MHNTDQDPMLTGDKRRVRVACPPLHGFFFSVAMLMPFWHLLFAGVCLWNSSSAGATEFLLEASAGYNSNPAKDEQSKGSGFTDHRLAVIEEFDPAQTLKVTIMSSAAYQNLWEMEDNHQFKIEGSIVSKASGARLLPYLFGSAYFNRDGLIESDERNEYTLGAGADWLALRRCTFSVEHAWKRIDYLSGSVPFAHGSGKMTRGASSPVRKVQQPNPAADDVGMTVDVTLEMFISPSLKASATMGVERLNSSVDMESYWQLTPGMNIQWNIVPFWQLMLDFQAERRNYNEIKRERGDIRESNDRHSMEMKLSRFWGKLEVFADFFIEQGEYPLNRESYHQQEAQCGISWSF
jgi:hypothetical protein